MKKNISLKDAVAMIKDGSSIMVGGFLGCGAPSQIIDALVESGVKDLTIICNDTVFDGKGWSKLIENHQVKEIYATYIGGSKASIQQMNEGLLKMNLVPQGTLAEKIRAKGAGLGGFLTPTGMGTVVAEGKKVINVQGKDYLLEEPIGADFALIKGSIVDESGNVFYRGTTKNFNPMMAQAADTVIVEAEKVVKVGEIEPECVHTPALFVDYIYVEQ
ncbi:MAG: CoA transferase subunit A [Bacteroidales bacterium]|nr:CoA transferase subunit A [Candidatus Cacconaster caballi]